LASEVQGNIAGQTLPDNLHGVLFEQLTEVVDRDPHDAALNMAIDEVLLYRARTPQLRIYRWSAPAVSFGYFGVCREVAAQWPTREMVRRWTGGGVVPHGDDLTYTLVVPRSCAFFSLPLGESYRAIHERIASMMPESQIAESEGRRISEACFENCAQYDVVIRDRKIAGAAQRRTRAGLLHQGSIQHAPSSELAAALPHVLAANVTQRPLSAEELLEAQSLAGTKYRTEAWLRRR